MQNDVPANEIVAVDKDHPLLRPMKKNCAHSTKLAFLEERFPAYKDALLISSEASTLYLGTVLNDWFLRYPWTLPCAEEPSSSAPPENHPERLTEQERKLKGAVIKFTRKVLYNWFDYRAKKTVPNIHRSKGKSSPIATILSRLTGERPNVPKLLTGWETYGKEEFLSMKSDFERSFLESGKSEKLRVAASNDFKQARFALLSAEDQEIWTQRGIQSHEDAKRAAKEKKEQAVLLEPAEAQEAIDNLGSFIGPLIEGIGMALGWHVSVIVGGPEPRKKGQLNLISYHHGANKAPSPCCWALADKVKFRPVQDSFVEYLQTCYTPEEQRVRSMFPLDELTSPDDPGPSTSSIVPVPQGKGAAESETADKIGGRKRKHKDVKGRKSRKQKKKAKLATSLSDVESDPVPTEPDTSSDEEGSGDDGHVSSKSSRLVSRLGSGGGVDQNATREAVNPVTTINMSINPASISNVDGDTDMLPTTPQPSQTRELSPPPGDHNPIDGSWPAWFKLAHTALTLDYMGIAFAAVVSKFVELEDRTGFRVGGVGAGFGTGGRPAQVSAWVKDGRKSRPMIERDIVPAFAAEWWGWWKGLQPTWREVSAVEGALSALHRETSQGIGGWSVMNKHGQNAFFTVLATLCWWGSALGGARDFNSDWVAAVDDVSWVLTQILLTPPPTPRPKTVKKRRRF